MIAIDLRTRSHSIEKGREFKILLQLIWSQINSSEKIDLLRLPVIIIPFNLRFS